jgi:hypothetical protein
LRTGELVSLRVTRREPWLAMAYSCLSVLEWRASRHPRRGDVRAGAELLYGIEREVLRKLGGLTADLGDETTARKIGTRSLRRVPTPQEITWSEAAIKLVIRRVGKHAADPTASRPTRGMRDLPPL